MLYQASQSPLRQLCHLRWLAIAGQALTVAVVTGPLHIALPAAPLWAGIAALTLFNLYALRASSKEGVSSNRVVFLHMVVDVTVLGWMIGWSGGLENPFSSLFLLPIALSILALPVRWVWATAAVSIAGFVLSTTLAHAMPHVHNLFGDAFGLHKAGMMVNFAVSAAVVLVFFTRMAEAWRASTREIALLRERFTRNEGILALATHAASVAHELNTPLGTLTLMVEEMADEADTEARRADCETMRSLLGICRDRVRELAAPAASAGIERVTGVELERVIARWQLIRPAVELRRTGSAQDLRPIDPAAGHLLQALLNNAADASERAGSTRVDLHLECVDGSLQASIRDYGAGFERTSPSLPGTLFRSNKPGGLGVGLALSHATVERLGGELSMQPAAEGPGVVVSFRLPTEGPA